MTTTPLDTLLLLRRHELETVEQTFASAVKRENDAAAVLLQAETHLIDEQAFASQPDADDEAVEAFSVWLPVGRSAVEAARQAAHHAGLDREVARMALMMARAALEAVETLQDNQRLEKTKAALRSEQHVLDEAGARQAGEL